MSTEINRIEDCPECGCDGGRLRCVLTREGGFPDAPEIIAAAEARGYQRAIDLLRAEAEQWEQWSAANSPGRADPDDVTGAWFSTAADYLVASLTDTEGTPEQ